MGEPVKRSYRSELRTTQAAQTRRAVVAAAAELFVAQGYGPTTVDAVAAAAGVSRKTVFNSVGGKSELLRLAVDWAIAGDDEPRSLADRAVVIELLDQPDPVVLLTGWARLQTDIASRVTPLFSALEAAAGIDLEVQALLDQLHRQRLAGARRIVERLGELDALPQRLPVREAVDLVWLAGDPLLFDRMVRIRKWSKRRFGDWLGTLLTTQVLGRPVRAT